MGEPDPGHNEGTARTDTRRLMLASLAALAAAVVLWGGYSHRWPWTGINGGTATLWDWLHLLLLPLAVAVLPVWFRSDTRVGRRTKSRGATGLSLFIVLVILGYTIPWAWTGFEGNTLWDWLKLLVLPLAVVLVPRAAELRRAWSPRHTTIALAGSVIFAVIVVAGYLVPWSWTGFTGNTLWDWLNLLFLPLLLPIVIVPALTPKMMGEVIYLDADGNPIEVEVVEAPAAEAAALKAEAAPRDVPPAPAAKPAEKAAP